MKKRFNSPTGRALFLFGLSTALAMAQSGSIDLSQE